MPVTCVARYQREVAASLDRVWENVLDWEHLPWLHRTTFASIALRHRDRTGFRAEVALHRGPPFVLEVAIDVDARRYHSRTIAGPAAGSDIVTHLTPIAPRRTGVAVEFLIPDVAPARVAAVGDAYVRLYERLWDEDEAMMIARQTALDAPAPCAAVVVLGPRATLWPRLPLTLDTAAGRVRLQARGDRVLAHAATCPHLGGPLEEAPGDDGCLTCPWHGYRFDLDRGASCDGRGLTLRPRATIESTADGRLLLHVAR